MKQMVWEKIAFEYNATPPVSVTMSIKQLRRLWMNLKQRKRGSLPKEDHRTVEAPQPSDGDSYPEVSILTPVISVEEPINPDSDFCIKAESPHFKSTRVTNFTSLDTNRQDFKVGDGTTDRPEASSTFDSHSMTDQPSLTPPNGKYIIEKEYQDRKARAGELHQLEKLILKEKLREAKAKADLAELLFNQQQSYTGEHSQGPLGSGT